MSSKEQPSHNASEDLLSSSRAKGERLKRVRYLANLSREEFCAEDDLNITTLISWEIGRFGGLSQKGAQRVVARVAKEGVFCTPEWLLYEVGAGPKVEVDYKKNNRADNITHFEKNETDEDAAIIEELMFFRKVNKQSIDCIIEDDGMLPHYHIGDYVAGRKRHAEQIKKLIGLDCIVQTKDGLLIMRNLQMGPQPNSFNLVCTNLQANVKDKIIYNIELTSAAPVVWHRHKEPVK